MTGSGEGIKLCILFHILRLKDVEEKKIITFNESCILNIKIIFLHFQKYLEFVCECLRTFIYG